MHIAMVTGQHCPPERTDQPTGTQSQVVPLATRLAARGHDVTVYVPAAAEDSSASAGADGVHVEYVAVGTEDDDMPARYAEGLRRRWQQAAPDLAHASTWTAGLATVATERDDVAFVQDYRDTDGSHLDGAGQRLAAALGQRAQQAVVASNAQADALARHGVAKRGIAVVPYGVDDRLFTPDAARGERDGQLRLVCPDGTADGHGSDLLIQSLPFVPDAALLIVDYPEGERAGDQRQDLAAELDVADRVEVVDDPPAAELARLFQSADLVVSTPTADVNVAGCVEAMACGTAVLATSVGGRDEVVVDKVTGRLVAAQPEQMGATIHQLLHDPPRRRAYGIAAADRAAACYSWDRVADSVEGVYGNALSSGRFSGSRRHGSFRLSGLA